MRGPRYVRDERPRWDVTLPVPAGAVASTRSVAAQVLIENQRWHLGRDEIVHFNRSLRSNAGAIGFGVASAVASSPLLCPRGQLPKERAEDRVIGIGVAVTREDLLELKLHARPAGDHLRDRGSDRVLWLAPVLLGGIPDTTFVELERAARQDGRPGRVDHTPRIEPPIGVHHGATLQPRPTTHPRTSVTCAARDGRAPSQSNRR